MGGVLWDMVHRGVGRGALVRPGCSGRYRRTSAPAGRLFVRSASLGSHLSVLAALLQAAERLGGVQQEVAILRHAAAMPEEERQRQREARQAAGPPPDLLRQLHAAAGSLSSAAVQRQRLVDGVFRPSHVLPTMSVEQFGELEYARCAPGLSWWQE